MKFLIACFCLVGTIYCKAQIRFTDSLSMLPIPALNIYHSNGTLIGLTDKNGMLQLREGADKDIVLPMTLTTQHISYAAKNIRLSTWDEYQVYNLVPRATVIDEVVVTAKPKDVIVLRGYYRSLETFNLQHKCFSDGIVEFYIPLKGKPKFRRIDYRIFVDSLVTAEYNSKMGPFFQSSKLIEMNKEKLADRLTRFTHRTDGHNRITLLKEGKEVGYFTISNQEDNLQFYVDEVLPASVVKEKLFRLEIHRQQAARIENYATADPYNVGLTNLSAIYENEVGSIKRKSEYGHIPYEGLNEFYVLERQYLTAEEYKSIEKKLTKNIFRTPTKSNYSTRFWEDLDGHNIPPIPLGLKVKLGDSMRLAE